jgi:hypothetical protein
MLAASLAHAQSSLQSTFPTAKPASSALSDPVGRQLNIALGLAGALRKEASEGRFGGERAGQLIEQLHKTLLGARENPTAEDRRPGDEVWSRPQSEALKLVEDAHRQRLDAMKMAPSNAQVLALQQAADTVTRAFDKVSEASRKRHEASVNSVRNIK